MPSSLFQILIIDREETLPLEFQILVQIFPLEVIQVNNGLEALRKMTSGFLPDMIFAEADMDLISAKQFVKLVKANGFLQDIPIISFGWPEQLEDLQSMSRAGARQFIFKPLSISDIQDCLIWEMNQVQH